MKPLFAALLVALSCGVAHAGRPLPASDVPDKVMSTIRDYFPGATPLAAEKDVQANRIKYEVLVQYKAIQLEVDLAEDGAILDVGMER